MNEWRRNENVREKDGERKGERRRFIGFKPSDARFPKWRVLCIHKWHSCGTKRPPLFSGLVPLLTGIDEITFDIVTCSITITYHRTDPLFILFSLSLYFYMKKRLALIDCSILFTHVSIHISLLNFIVIDAPPKGLIVSANSVHQHTSFVNHRRANYRLISVTHRWDNRSMLKRMPSGLRDRNSRPCSRKIEIIGGPRVEGKKGVEGKHGGARGREGEGECSGWHAPNAVTLIYKRLTGSV